jgi:hypothetical protein
MNIVHLKYLVNYFIRFTPTTAQLIAGFYFGKIKVSDALNPNFEFLFS